MHSLVKRRRVIRLLAVVYVVLVGIVLAELSFRVVERLTVPATIQSYVENPHGTGSYRLEPGFEVATTVGGRERRISINSHGMHWKEVDKQKRDGTTRVAFLGDSFTFGNWARDAAGCFVGVADSILAGRRAEALNFGVGGYGLEDAALLLHEEVWAFEPDMVVVCIFTGNDFFDTYLGLDRYDISTGSAHLKPEILLDRVPAQHLDNVDELRRLVQWQQDPTFAARVKAGFRRHSALARGVEGIKDRLAGMDPADAAGMERQRAAVRAEVAGDSLRVSGSFVHFSFWSRVPYPDAALAARDRSLRALHGMYEEATAHGAAFGIVAVPYREQVTTPSAAGVGYDVAYPQKYVEEYAREHGIPYLDLLAPMRARRQADGGSQFYFADDPHLNDHGHHFAGVTIARWLVPLL